MTRHEETRNSAPQLGTCMVFPSELGWCAAHWHAGQLHRLSIANPSAIAAVCIFDGNEVDDATDDEELASFIERVQEFSGGAEDDFRDIRTPTDYGTPFRQRVLEACRRIPFGETRSYSQLATAAGSPRAARAVGNIMSQNRVPLVVPCHRVVAANSLGGFSAPDGMSTKRRLLALEGTLEEAASR